MAIDLKLNLPDIYGDESVEYTRLVGLGTNRTTINNVIFTSNTSAVSYDTATSFGGIYANQGENGLYLMLRNEVLESYLIDENWTTAVKTDVDLNTSGTSQSLEPIVPDSVVSQLITVTTPDSTKSKFTLDIQTTVTGGAITINRDGGGAKNLQTPDGTNVEELSQDNRFFDIYEDGAVFILAPKGGGLEFAENGQIIGFDNSSPTSLRTTVTDEGWIIAFLNPDSGLVNFNLEVDGSPVFGASVTNDGIGVTARNSFLLMIKFNTEFKLYCDSSFVCVSYVLGKTLDKAIPKMYAPTSSTSVSLQESVSGSGWIYGKNSQGTSNQYYGRLDVDGVTVFPSSNNSAVVLNAPLMYRFETGFDFYAPIANAVGISYSLD